MTPVTAHIASAVRQLFERGADAVLVTKPSHQWNAWTIAVEKDGLRQKLHFHPHAFERLGDHFTEYLVDDLMRQFETFRDPPTIGQLAAEYCRQYPTQKPLHLAIIDDEVI